MRELRILSQNLWGLPWTPRWRERRDTFASHLQDGEFDAYDVIVLQEVWLETDAESLAAVARSRGFAYTHVCQSRGAKDRVPIGGAETGFFGVTGLAVFSRLRAQSSTFHRYATKAPVTALLDGEAFVSRGVLHVRFEGLDLFVTHIVGLYGQPPHSVDVYHETRTLQAAEALLVMRGEAREAVAVLCGDLNCLPGTLAQGLLRGAGLRDPAEECVAGEALRRRVTCDSHRCSWGHNASPAPVPDAAPEWDVEESGKDLREPRDPHNPPARMDFFLLRARPGTVVKPTHSRTLHIRTAAGFSISDHFGVDTALSVADTQASATAAEPWWPARTTSPTDEEVARAKEVVQCAVALQRRAHSRARLATGATALCVVLLLVLLVPFVPSSLATARMPPLGTCVAAVAVVAAAQAASFVAASASAAAQRMPALGLRIAGVLLSTDL